MLRAQRTDIDRSSWSNRSGAGRSRSFAPLKDDDGEGAGDAGRRSSEPGRRANPSVRFLPRA
ncbi:MAG: hypothetical protein AVDCRST_MAG64-733 [uncultured Phycisphaerae bacterium]|uniref:Uncharacterized protein n=1 Tax=uncultured Phycisphaerae bacterium TaxID=904963 RepID=A0A6J4NAN6_9BACT|nr:MAG: hypothetical protein AVDCRST_MAG64-733 [uncultured Phycisphaerae bacterium]